MTVINEKSLDTKHSAEELAKNLSRHGIDVILDKVDAAGRPIGVVLEAHAASCNADILVMGAYGHSRFREFILGGATKSLCRSLPFRFCFRTDGGDRPDCGIDHSLGTDVWPRAVVENASLLAMLVDKADRRQRFSSYRTLSGFGA